MAATDRRPADDLAEPATADSASDAGMPVGMAVTGLALPNPRSAPPETLAVNPPGAVEAVRAAPVVQALRRLASARELADGRADGQPEPRPPASVPRLAATDRAAALRRQAATVTGRPVPPGAGQHRSGEQTTIRRTLQDAIAWGAKRDLAFTSDADVQRQLEAWTKAGDSPSLNQRDELLVAYRRAHPELSGPSAEVLAAVGADYSGYDSDDDLDFEPDESSSSSSSSSRKKPSKRAPRKSVVPSVDPTYSFTKTHKKKGGGMGSRPSGYGPVEVSHQSIEHVSLGRLDRPVSASGLVAPTVTSGRPSAPEPASGLRISTSKKGGLDPRNSGIVDAHKGHIFALELGGPDVAENIVAQFGHFQSVGVWRAAERAALAFAKEMESTRQRVEFEVQLHYKPYLRPELGSRKGLLFPSRFTVTVRPVNGKTGERGPAKTLFDGQNLQDEGQFREGNKKLDKADEQLEPEKMDEGADED